MSRLQLYLSHTGEDSELALSLEDFLERECGHDVWLALRDASPDLEDWRRANEHEVERCDQFILLLSPASMDSREVYNEVTQVHEEIGLQRKRNEPEIKIRVLSLVGTDSWKERVPSGLKRLLPRQVADYSEAARGAARERLKKDLAVAAGRSCESDANRQVVPQLANPNRTIPAGEGEPRLIVGALDAYAGAAELCQIEIVGSQLVVRGADMEIARGVELGFEPDGLWLATDGRRAVVKGADRVAILSLGDGLTPSVIADNVDGWDPATHVLGVASYGDWLRLIGSSESETCEMRVGFRPGGRAEVNFAAATGEGRSSAAVPLPDGFVRVDASHTLGWVAVGDLEQSGGRPPLEATAECIDVDAASGDDVVLLAALSRGRNGTEIHVARSEGGAWQQVTVPVGEEGGKVQTIRVVNDGGAPTKIAMRSGGQFSLWDWDDLRCVAVDDSGIETTTIGQR